MKQSLLFFMIICFHILSANNYYQSNYNTYNQFSTFENQVNYSERINKDITFNLNSTYSSSSNSYFDRNSKSANYNLNLTFERYIFKPFIIYDYSAFYNTGLPEDTEAINDKKVNRTGFGVKGILFGNTVSFEQKNHYIQLDSPTKEYYGWQNDTRLTYFNRFNANTISSSAFFTMNDIFLDKNNSRGAEIAYRYNNKNHFNTRFLYSQYEREIYTYNQRDDTSSRDEYLAEIDFSVNITDNFKWTMSDKANFRRLYYEKASSRDNWTFENDMIYQLDLKTELGEYFTRLNLINSERYIKANDQSRRTEEKKITYGVQWSFTFVDTVRLEMTNSIMQNYHSGSFNTLDNDRILHTYSAFLINNFHKHTLKNTFQVLQGEQVYIAKLLSANNHTKTSYLWSPEAEIFLNRNFNLINKYQIRADYEYFTFIELLDNNLKDRFYRYMIAEWGLKFTHQNQYSLIKYSTFELYPAFILTHTETAQYEKEQWKRNSYELLRTYLFSIKYQTQSVAIRIQPQVKYLDNDYETDIQADASINYDDLFVTASINPVGRQWNEMIWRFNLNIGFQF